MKRFLLSLVALAFLTFSPSPADAACAGGTCYMRSVGGNWSNTTTAWSTTSTSGAACSCAPATGDAIVMDATSGANAIDTTFSISTFDATGFTNTLTQSATLTVTGNTFKLASGMTFSSINRTVLFTPASGNTVTVTSAGKAFGRLTLTGADSTAKLTLADNLLVNQNSNGIITTDTGIFDAATNNVTVTAYNYNAPNAASTTQMGTGQWTISGDDISGTSAFNIATASTFTGNTTSNLVFNMTTPSSTVSLVTGGKSFGTVTYSAGSNFASALRGSGYTVTTLNITSPTRILNPDAAASGTITNALNISGSSSNPILIEPNVNYTATGTITIASGSVTNWVSFRGIVFGGSGTKLVATNCNDYKAGNNFNGGTCTAPSTGGSKIIGG